MKKRSLKALRWSGALIPLLVSACDQAPPPNAGVATTTGSFEGKLKLTCVGRTTRLGGVVVPFEEVIYVDRAAGKYCGNTCELPEDIHSQTEVTVVFRDFPSDGINLKNRATWHPMTGRYRAVSAWNGVIHDQTETTAICVAAPYEGSIPNRP